MKPRIVVLTGSIASGKSSAIKILEDLGYPCYRADDYSRDIYKGELLEKISYYFPEAVEEARLNRKKLREIIARDEGRRKLLNKVTHERIISEMARDIGKLDGLAFAEIPLYYEAKDLMDKYFDIVLTIFIEASPGIRLARLKKRDSLDKLEAERELDLGQQGLKNKSISDIIIKNDQGMDILEKNLKKAIEVIDENC